jgi:uncharacterized membrane protein
MELDGSLFSNAHLWWFGLIYGGALLAALYLAPWKRLRDSSQLHVFLGAVVVLIVLWHLRGQVQPGLSYHVLGVTTLTLMFGWSMAIIASSLALVAVSLNAGYGWEGYLASILTVSLLPISLTQLILILARSWLPKHFFVYVLGNAFLTGWLVAYISGYLAVALLVMSGAYTLAELEVTIVPFFPLMFFPEAIVNGWIVTIMVLFCPTWVHTFNDEQYVRGK